MEQSGKQAETVSHGAMRSNTGYFLYLCVAYTVGIWLYKEE